MQVAESSNDSIKLRIYNKIGFYYIFNDPVRAKELLLKGIKQSRIKKVPFSEAELVNTYGIYYDVAGKSDSAKYYFEKALTISKAHDYKTITVMIINNLGMFHWNKGDYQEALDYFFRALEMSNSFPNSSEDTYYSNIGLIYQDMGLLDKSLEYHYKALEIRRKLGDKKNIAISLNNIGIILSQRKKYGEAKNTFKEAIKTASEVNEFGVLYNASDGLAHIYILTGEPEKAIPILKKSIHERDRLIIDRRANLSSIAYVIDAYLLINQLDSTKVYINKGNDFLVDFPELRISAIDFYSSASKVYFMDQNYPEGMDYFDKTLAAKDSIFSTENAQKIANLETKFKVSEKEKSHAQTRANLAEKELEVEQKNLFIFGMVALVLFLGTLGFLVYREQKLKNNQLQKEGELKVALAKIEIQNQLQEQRLRISRDLHDNIGSQLTFIISSIDNLKYRLANTGNEITDKLGAISKFTTQTIYELRDTIWAMNKTDISMDDLQARISNFIEKAQVSSDVDFQFEVDNALLKEMPFTSVEGMNIYRIIQESVNNALKYSEASLIKVRIAKAAADENEKVEVSIFDDGIGFQVEKAKSGNGLANIKKRAKELGGKVEVTSKEKAGTVVKLIF